MDWNQRYRAADTPWDKPSAHPSLKVLKEWNLLRGPILVPGCGTGNDCIYLAEQGRGVSEIVGLDLAPEALDRARAKQGSHMVDWQLGNFLNLASNLKLRFNCIVEHTCFCAIDPRDRPGYVQSTFDALIPGGALFGIFFTGLSVETDGPPWGTSAEEIEALFSPGFEVKNYGAPEQTFPEREGIETLWLLTKQDL